MSPHLSSGNKDGSDGVGGMCVEATNAAGHGRTHQVFTDVEVNKGRDGRLERGRDDVSWHNGVTHNRFTTSLQPGQ